MYFQKEKSTKSILNKYKLILSLKHYKLLWVNQSDSTYLIMEIHSDGREVEISYFVLLISMLRCFTNKPEWKERLFYTVLPDNMV